MEIWRSSVSMKGYQVSSIGRVRNANGRLRKLTRFSNEYLGVSTREKCYLVHRLVAEAFIPNPDGLPTVNHKNYARGDNRVENLEWVSYSDNHKHAHEKDSRKRHKWAKPVVGLPLADDRPLILVNNTKSTEHFGFDRKEVCRCLNGSRGHKHKGYVWFRLSDYEHREEDCDFILEKEIEKLSLPDRDLTTGRLVPRRGPSLCSL
jgi:hypothetical protein